MAEREYTTTGEILTGAYLVGRAAITALRGGDLSKHDRAFDRLNGRIEERRRVEEKAREELAAEKAEKAERERIEAEKKRQQQSRWF